MSCAVCKKGPAEGVSVFRMNAKGQPGLWACREHMDQFDGSVPKDVDDLVRVIENAQKDQDQ